MITDRLDKRALDKISGPAWSSLRSSFETINDMLLSVSRDATGELTTIYVKYFASDTGGQPFAVLWLKKASELTLGLSLPEEEAHERLVPAPKGCKYAGLTKYLVVRQPDDLPSELNEWVASAYKHARAGVDG